MFIELFLRGNPLVVTNHLGDEEMQETLRKHRVETRLFGKSRQTLDLVFFAIRIASGKAVLCLEGTHGLRELEAFGEEMHEGSVDIVDRASVLAEHLPSAGNLFVGDVGPGTWGRWRIIHALSLPGETG